MPSRGALEAPLLESRTQRSPEVQNRVLFPGAGQPFSVPDSPLGPRAGFPGTSGGMGCPNQPFLCRKSQLGVTGCK